MDLMMPYMDGVEVWNGRAVNPVVATIPALAVVADRDLSNGRPNQVRLRAIPGQPAWSALVEQFGWPDGGWEEGRA